MSEKATAVYRALVVSNADPLKQKRVLLQVPQVLGTARSAWAEPMTEVAQAPVSGTLVWAFFHGGDMTKPLYLPQVPGSEQWHDLQASDLQNSWQLYGGGYTVSYYKDATDTVHLKGLLKSPSAAAPVTQQLIFTLPVGYRPGQERIYGQVCQATSAQRIDVNTDGTVRIVTPIALTTNQWVTLDNIHFRAEN